MKLNCLTLCEKVSEKSGEQMGPKERKTEHGPEITKD